MTDALPALTAPPVRAAASSPAGVRAKDAAAPPARFAALLAGNTAPDGDDRGTDVAESNKPAADEDAPDESAGNDGTTEADAGASPTILAPAIAPALIPLGADFRTPGGSAALPRSAPGDQPTTTPLPPIAIRPGQVVESPAETPGKTAASIAAGAAAFPQPFDTAYDDRPGPVRARPSGRGTTTKTAAVSDRIVPPSPLAAAPAIGGDLQPLLAARDAPSAIATPSAMPAHAAHDFGAIVDRLVEPRQAGASVATGTTLVHPEFGHVRLQLREGDGHLAVALSSPDPGFAPVAEAAVRTMPLPTPPPSVDAESTSTQAQGAAADKRQGGGSAPHGETPSDRPRENRPQTAQSRGSATKPSGGIYA